MVESIYLCIQNSGWHPLIVKHLPTPLLSLSMEIKLDVVQMSSETFLIIDHFSHYHHLGLCMMYYQVIQNKLKTFKSY